MIYPFKQEITLDYELQYKLKNYCEIHHVTKEEAIKYILNTWLDEYDFEWIKNE